MIQDFNSPERLIDQVKEFLNTRIAQLKLLFADRVSKVIAVVIGVFMSALIFFLFLVLLCIAGGIALGQWFENYWLGFLAMSGIILLLGLLLWKSKDSWLKKPIMNALVKVLFEKEEGEKN